MRKMWTKLAAYAVCGVMMCGTLTFLPQSPFQMTAEAHGHGRSNHGCRSSQNSQTYQYGWCHNADGSQYRNSDGSYVKGGFSCVDDKWYYFDQDGYMVKGWQQVGDDWYYFDSNGCRVSGEAAIGGRQYCFNSDGKLDGSYYCDGVHHNGCHH